MGKAPNYNQEEFSAYPYNHSYPYRNRHHSYLNLVNHILHLLDQCKYWEWRLKDVRLSRDKAAQENVKRSINGCPKVPIGGFYDDVSRIKKAFEQHKLFEQVA